MSGPYLWNRYSQRLQIECAAWSCGLVVHYCLPTNSLRYFFYFIFFLIFFAKILSGPYLWNCYLQRLQIECAAWFCGLILHYCLPSNSLRYFLNFFFIFSATILSGLYLWNCYSQRLQIECAAWSCGLILHCCLPSNSLRYWTKFRGIAPRLHTGRLRTCLVIVNIIIIIIIMIIIIIISDPRRGCYIVLSMFIFSIFFLFIYFFFATICPGHISGTVTRRDFHFFSLFFFPVGLFLHYCLPSNSLRLFFLFIFFFLFFRHDFVRAISLEPLLAETPN